jgi:acyl-CoA thioesterase-1
MTLDTHREPGDIPFWQAGTMRESALPIRWTGEPSPVARLLYLPKQILSVTSATREIAYEAGQDYQVDLATGEIRLPAGSRILYKEEVELYPRMGSDQNQIANRRGMPEVGILFGEGDFYHRLQAEVTYTCAPGQWRGYVPSFADKHRLPRTMDKLWRQEPLRLLLVGDSISEGYNASGLSNVPPFCPPYGEQVAAGLERAYGGQVILENHAVAGWSSAQGLEQIRSERLADRRPDLVIIAYGMNDAWASDPVGFQGIIGQIMEEFCRAEYSLAEFRADLVLVAPMLPNPELHIPSDQFPAYRDALAALCGPGVILADMTAVWTELLKRKTFWDVTGNGVNHPNDFGHRLYAQTLLGLLVPH